MRKVRNIGKTAYTAYVEKVGGISPISGDWLPNWEELPEDIQKGWEYAAEEVIIAEGSWTTKE